MNQKTTMLNQALDANFGINFVGHLSGEYGLGEGSRATLRAIEAAGIPFVLKDIKVDWHRNLDSSYTNFSDQNPYPINLIHTLPEPVVFNMIDPACFKGRYNIGFWAWELPLFPPGWLYAFSLFDEIWTYSNYCAEAIAPVSPVPVIKVMSSLELPEPSLSRKELGLPENKFIFLFMFDFHSTIARKNPFATLEAFKQAFASSNQDVLLVLKFSNGNFYPKEREQLKAQAAGWPVHFIDGHLKRDELHALVANCDCYVSLHRAEGFGLTMAEAMYYGKPVIATAYSSNMEFMNVGNSFPVKYDIVKLTQDYGPYFRGNYWAEPHVEHAAFLMKYVFENPQEAKKVGSRASQEIKTLLSPELLGVKIKNRLEIIKNRISQSTNWSTRIHKMQQESAFAQSKIQVWRQTTQQVQAELARYQKLAKI